MIVTYDSIFGYISIIVFQLAERIAIVNKSIRVVLGHCKNMLGFSYLAIPTRHEIRCLPYLHDAFEQINPQNLKRLRMWLNKNSIYLTLTLAVAVGLSTANK